MSISFDHKLTTNNKKQNNNPTLLFKAPSSSVIQNEQRNKTETKVINRIISMKHDNKITFKQRVMDFINLCATPITVSHYLELVNPLWVSHKLQALVVDVWDETKNSRTLTL